MNRELVYTRKGSDEIIPCPEPELEKAIADKYDFIIGFIPEGYSMALLLVSENTEDARKDVWITVFYKITKNFGKKTITLENIHEIQEGKDFVDLFKDMKGNFEDEINISIDMIKKYYLEVTGKEPIET